MSTKYAIRQNEFAHNGDWYLSGCVMSSSIIKTFENFEEANKTYKELLANDIRNYLWQYDIGNGEASEDIYEAIDKFTEEKLGKVYEYGVDDIDFDELSDDEVVEFAKITDMELYELEKIDGNKELYVIYLNYHNDYFRNYKGEIISSDDSNYFVKSEDVLDYFLDFLNEIPPTGTVTELAKDPSILEENFKEKYPLVELKDGKLQIEKDFSGFIYDDSFDKLKLINSSLKTPWFEVRKITQAELEALNQQ